MYEMNSKRQWHFDEQERIRKQGFSKRNGGQLVNVDMEKIGWGRQKRRINKLLKKESHVMEIVKTVINGDVKK
jgi:hypothetical protein